MDAAKPPITEELRPMEEPAEDERAPLVADAGSDQLDRAILIALGQQLKAERQRAELTLRQLSQRTGLSVAMLSKIENAQAVPSLRTLVRLSTSLGIHVGSLLSGFERDQEPSLVKAGQGIELQSARAGGGLRYELLAESHPAGRLIQPFLITVPRERTEFPLYQHRGSEFIHILEGAMLFRYGRKTYELAPGDSLLFAGLVPHGPKQVLEAPVKFLSVTSERLPGSLIISSEHVDLRGAPSGSAPPVHWTGGEDDADQP